MSQATMPAWLRIVARRVLVDFHRKRARRAKYEAPMPNEPVPSWSPDDDGANSRWEPSHDPRDASDEWTHTAGRLVRWLEEQVAAHPRDAETLQILLEHARESKTYGQIAQERGMTLTAVSSRIFEFKVKYMPRYRRERDRSNLLFLFLGAALVLAIVVVWFLLRPAVPAPRLEPPPSTPVPSPSASTSAAPFEPAGSVPSPWKRVSPDSKPGR
jgi:DNA-directed RNA polymerase specialized sigma24 family protein